MIIVFIGLVVADIMQIFSRSHDRKRKWRIVIIISLFGILFTPSVFSIPSVTQSVMVLWGLFIVAGIIGNYVNA
jgi:chromate transport protein ChrA